MPIYEYRCTDCGFQKEFLQKVSDPKLTTCTSCGKETFQKMLTAAGFQLKGSGWYATDFKNSGSKPAAKEEGVKSGKPVTSGDAAKTDTAKSGGDGAAAAKPSDTVAAPAKSDSASSASTTSGGSSGTGTAA